MNGIIDTHPQHLLDLTTALAEHGSKELLWTLTASAKFCYAWRFLWTSKCAFFGATLIPLASFSGEVQYIQSHSFCGDGSCPQQLECGVPLGCETAAHATWLFIQNMLSTHLLLKIDFKNAFNTLRHDKILEAVRGHVPEVFPFVYAAYGKPTLLCCWNHTLQSEEGVQQGDT